MRRNTLLALRVKKGGGGHLAADREHILNKQAKSPMKMQVTSKRSPSPY